MVRQQLTRLTRVGEPPRVVDPFAWPCGEVAGAGAGKLILFVLVIGVLWPKRSGWRLGGVAAVDV